MVDLEVPLIFPLTIPPFKDTVFYIVALYCGECGIRIRRHGGRSNLRIFVPTPDARHLQDHLEYFLKNIGLQSAFIVEVSCRPTIPTNLYLYALVTMAIAISILKPRESRDLVKIAISLSRFDPLEDLTLINALTAMRIAIAMKRSIVYRIGEDVVEIPWARAELEFVGCVDRCVAPIDYMQYPEVAIAKQISKLLSTLATHVALNIVNRDMERVEKLVSAYLAIELHLWRTVCGSDRVPLSENHKLFLDLGMPKLYRVLRIHV